MWLRVRIPVRGLWQAACALALGSVIGCSVLLDVPKPALDTRGGAGISISLCPAVHFCRAPQQLLVVALNESGDLLAPRQVLLSKWTFHEDGFLLNTPPGTYGVVGAIFTLQSAYGPMAVPPRPGNRGTYTVYFPETMVN
jgi:hypothetical protein